MNTVSCTVYLAVFIVYFPNIRGENGTKSSEPRFLSTMVNASVTVGRDAALTCHISHSEGYKVAWVRVDTQTVLTMSEHVITKNHRISVSAPERDEWRLEIKDTRRTDAGHYMCQINTDPMQSQLAYLDIVEPPSILSTDTSADQRVGEGEDVVLSCRPGGHPAPVVRWRREDGRGIRQSDGEYSPVVVGQVISLASVSRRDRGAYLCIASNGVPPAVSHRISLEVVFPPSLALDQDTAVARPGANLRLGCSVEAVPEPVMSWATNNRAITKGGRYQIYTEKRRGFVDTSLIIAGVNKGDHGTSYVCSGRNSLGSAEKRVTIHVVDDGVHDTAEAETEAEEEVILSRPRQRDHHQPTLEIIEIELPEVRQHQYPDPISTFEEIKFKTESKSQEHGRNVKRKPRKKFKPFLSSGASFSFQFGIPIIFPIVCLKLLTK